MPYDPANETAAIPLRPVLIVIGAGLFFAGRIWVRDVLLPALVPKPINSAGFTRPEAEELFGRGRSAEARTQILYHEFKKDRDPALPVPAWLDREVASMTRVIWTEKDDALTEADLWKAPPAVIYEFFESLRPLFPPEYGGSLRGYETLSAGDNVLRCRLAAERPKQRGLESSLEGRGGALIAAYAAACDAMQRAGGAAQARDVARFHRSVMDLAARVRDADAVVNAPSR